jgi:cytidyltransferase-like protein
MNKYVFWVFLCLFSANKGLVLEDLYSQKEIFGKRLSKKRIGYYFGSFDPLHLGHESLVQEILDQDLCDYIIVCPAWGGDDFKQRSKLNVRLEMLFSTFSKHEKIIISALCPGEIQTILNTLKDPEYIGIIGSDTALLASQIPEWISVFMTGESIPKKYQEHTIGGTMLVSAKSFIVGVRREDEKKIQDLKGIFGNRIIVAEIRTKYANVASSNIQKERKSDHKIDNQVSGIVLNIIEKNNLYRKN